jgi:hypothetical protein
LNDLTRHFDDRLAQILMDYLTTCKVSGKIARDDAVVSAMVSLMQAVCFILVTIHPNFPPETFKQMAEGVLLKMQKEHPDNAHTH